jgi:hypothetical protein
VLGATLGECCDCCRLVITAVNHALFLSEAAVQHVLNQSDNTRYWFRPLSLDLWVIESLLAPQSGDETRRYVSRKAKDASDYAQRKAQEVQERAGTLLEQGKEAIKEKKQQVSAAVDAGREAAYRLEIAKGKATGVD